MVGELFYCFLDLIRVRSLIPSCDNAWITSSFASFKALQDIGFPFKNEPVLSAPVKA